MSECVDEYQPNSLLVPLTRCDRKVKEGRGWLSGLPSDKKLWEARFHRVAVWSVVKVGGEELKAGYCMVDVPKVTAVGVKKETSG